MSLERAVLKVFCIGLCLCLETGDAACESLPLAQSSDVDTAVLNPPRCIASAFDKQAIDTKKEPSAPDCNSDVESQRQLPSGQVEVAMLGANFANPSLTDAQLLQTDQPTALQKIQAQESKSADPWSQHAMRFGLSPVIEPNELNPAGRDIYQRRVMMSPGAKRAWLAMQAAAQASGVQLLLVSAFRSRSQQTDIVRRKLARGIPIELVLSVNAAPGFSEHHSGNAVDISTPGMPPAEESFESTAAYRWLLQRAAEFGFTMSYPRDNPYGIVYEPWHWYWRGE